MLKVGSGHTGMLPFLQGCCRRFPMGQRTASVLSTFLVEASFILPLSMVPNRDVVSLWKYIWGFF